MLTTADAARLSLLGGFGLRVGAAPLTLATGLQRLVALLALRGAPLRRAYVAGLLWGDTTEERAHASLRSCLWKLRACEVPLVETLGDCLELSGEVEVDVTEVSRISRHLVGGGFAEDSVRLLDPRSCGELLPGWYDGWVLIERERHRQLTLHALELLCTRLTRERRFGAAVLAGLAAVDREPLRESAHRALIGVHLAENNSGEALLCYRRYAELARRELGVEPSAAMHALVRPGRPA